MTQAALEFATRQTARPVAPADMEMVVDSFAGIGGASVGIEAADGWAVDVAINHLQQAIDLHARNHPNSRHIVQDIFAVEPEDVVGDRVVGLLWASPVCTHHSKARGGRPRRKNIRGLASRMLYWARKVQPRVIVLENVEEFQTWCRLDRRTGQPDKRKWGEYFTKFVRRLQAFGYTVEWDILNAADYGAPTARHRLFVIARRDGRPIVWPKPTHGPERPEPYHTAAECIDWALPTYSIFLTKKEARAHGVKRPLAEKTMQRIARGVVKFVLNEPEPFVMVNTSGHAPTSARDPLATVTTGNHHYLVSPFLAKYHHAKGAESRCRRVDGESPTLDTQNRLAVVTPFLAKWRGQSSGADAQEPMPTITSGHGSVRPAGAAHAMGVVVPHLTKFRTSNTAGGNCRLAGPMHTITGQGNQYGMVACHVSKFYGTGTGSPCDQPLGTVTQSKGHFGLVAAWLLKYYGTAIGQTPGKPLDTVTAKIRFGLVTCQIAGETYAIADIGLRMLQPHELLRAQFGEYSEGYVLTGTKAQQVAGVGNSVCPHVAAAVVKANFRRRPSSLKPQT